MALYTIRFPWVCESPVGDNEIKRTLRTEVELSDKETRELVELIRASGGETDVEALNLEEKMPGVYSKLYAACDRMSSHMVGVRWVLDGFSEGVFDPPEDLMERCIKDGLYSRDNVEKEDFTDEDGELDEEAYTEEVEADFDEWFDENFPLGDTEEEEYECIMKYYEDTIGEGEMPRASFTVTIPEEIIQRAKG